jgi:hypothetical protein
MRLELTFQPWSIEKPQWLERPLPSDLPGENGIVCSKNAHNKWDKKQ